MRLKLIIKLLILLLLNINCYATKRALIIAVANYTEESGWMPVSSDRDAQLISFALQKQGFDLKNINIILDKRATKASIIKAFEELEKSSELNDLIYIHFSGHGQQIYDDTKDELDGYDESLIPFDAPKKYSEKYKGENHLRDDELSVCLTKLRSKVGSRGEVLFTIDACNSGTAARSGKTFRGTKDKFSPSDFGETNQNTRIKESFFQEYSQQSEIIESLAPLVVISATAQDQLNYEYTDHKGNTYGSLSFAFAKVIATAKINWTYRTFFERIKVEMMKVAPMQSPEIEGSVDKLIFGGSFVKQQPYFTVEKVISSNTCVIKGGSVMGLTKGSILNIFPENTKSNKSSNILGSAEIIEIAPLSATLKWLKPISAKTLKSAWIFPERIALEEVNVSVFLQIESIQSELVNKEIKNLRGIKIVNRKEEANLIIVERDNELEMQDVKGNVIIALSLNAFPAKIVAALLSEIQRYKQAKLLANLEISDHSINVELELIPVTVKKTDGKWFVDKQLDIASKMENGSIHFNASDCFKIKIKNSGNKKAYYQIIDISPSNRIDVLYPSKSSNRTPSECSIMPKNEIVLKDIFVIGEAKGTEIMKVIASNEPINLEPIITSEGATKKGNLHNLELIIAQSFDKTRTLPISSSPETANINTYVILVK